METYLRGRFLSHLSQPCVEDDVMARGFGKQKQINLNGSAFEIGKNYLFFKKFATQTNKRASQVKLCGWKWRSMRNCFPILGCRSEFISRGVKCFWLVVFASLVLLLCRTKSFKIGYCCGLLLLLSLLFLSPSVYVLSFRRFFISPVHCLLHFDTSFVCLLRAEISFRITSGTHAACFLYLSQWPKNCATNTNGGSPAYLTIMESLSTHTSVFAVNILISFFCYGASHEDFWQLSLSRTANLIFSMPFGPTVPRQSFVSSTTSCMSRKIAARKAKPKSNLHKRCGRFPFFPHRRRTSLPPFNVL